MSQAPPPSSLRFPTNEFADALGLPGVLWAGSTARSVTPEVANLFRNPGLTFFGIVLDLYRNRWSNIIGTRNFHMLEDGTVYQDKGPGYYVEHDREAIARAAVRRLNSLGHVVILQPDTAA